MWLDCSKLVFSLLCETQLWFIIYVVSTVVNFFTYKLRVLSLVNAPFSHREEMWWIVRVFCPVVNTINIVAEPITYWYAKFRQANNVQN